MGDTALRGFVLAAGMGKRLQPFTLHTPKPLLTIAGVPALYFGLERLERLGIKDVMINAHHLVAQVERAIDNAPFDLKLDLSIETELLGSAGAFPKVANWRQGADLLVVNSDLLTDYDLNPTLAHFRKIKPLALMALLAETLPGENAVWTDHTHRIRAIDKEDKGDGTAAHGFACMHLLSDRFLRAIPNGFAEVIPLYRKAITNDDDVQGIAQKAYFIDMGTPVNLLRANLDWLKLAAAGAGPSALRVHEIQTRLGQRYRFFGHGEHQEQQTLVRGPAYIHESFDFGRKTVLGPYVVLGRNVQLKRCSLISHSTFMDDAQVTGDPVNFVIASKNVYIQCAPIQAV